MMQYSQTPLPSFEDLKHDVAGKWEYILSELAPELDEAIAAESRHVPCPVHGGTDGFRLYSDYRETGGGVCNTCGAFKTGFALLAWVRGYSLKDATRDIGRWNRGEAANKAVVVRQPVPPKPPRDLNKAYESIRRTWLESKSLAGTLAETYLAKRGIWKENMPTTLRFHPQVGFYDVKTKRLEGRYPCLIAPIKDAQGRLVSLHRIYLDEAGNKAPVPQVKKMMAPAGELRGAAIKLYQSADVLGLTEGIETALAVHAISRMPVWACVSARLMESVEVPPTVRHVYIWADKDRETRLPSGEVVPPAGESSAKRLAKRLRDQGLEVSVLVPQTALKPEQKKLDWLDIMLQEGLDGFPPEWRVWTPECTKHAA